MSSLKVFITGGSGFLGSAIITNLLNGEFEILATKRTQTNIWRCNEFNSNINWIDTKEETFVQQVVDFKPDIILHAAWSGIKTKDRDDWIIQMENFEFLHVLLDISAQVKPRKFIVLGSQAEYGNANKKSKETDNIFAKDAYAVCKSVSQQIITAFCRQNNINWYWLRVFSVFGPKEDKNWFIPAMIINQLKQADSDLTLCEQKYDYLYIDDFASMIEKVVSDMDAESGIYNICSGNAISLKTIVELISQNMDNKSLLNFGALPYRENQSMYIEGDNGKFNEAFGAIQTTNLSLAIQKTIRYYKSVS